jgi:hypothetical protein
MSKTVALVLLVCALALPSAALGATGLARGGGVLEAGCPVDPVAADVFCPPNPIWFSLQAKKSPQRTSGRFMTRWLVAGKARSLFAGGVRCMNAVGNAVVVGGLLTNPRALLGVPFVAYAVDNGASGDLVSDLGLFPDGDPDLLLLPVGFPSICPAPGLAASIYGYLPVFSGGVLVRPPTP